MTLDEILYQYKTCCALCYYNKLQIELIKESKLDVIKWIELYAVEFSINIRLCECVEDLKKRIYKEKSLG